MLSILSIFGASCQARIIIIGYGCSWRVFTYALFSVTLRVRGLFAVPIYHLLTHINPYF